ncbi:amidase [Natrinema sp. 1APR25-10V2]|uniref:amidase n=1 Tax=Natrinema sp. 1APR25-10V2 TaxID=2951081 RepID=UPI0028767C28|nr:amidase [Natrinema sp. 1APR25-10V2]MDS0474501.1 amidase family protein [Natrinema sp. 1APR25-10V2]
MIEDDITGAIEAAAAVYGIPLSDEGREEYAAEAEATAELLGGLGPTAFESDAAENVRDGSDPYNAFLYRCELSGAETGPLAGLDVAVKDNIAVAGVPMTCGSAALEFEPAYHAAVTERLLGAGATLVGTTNMDEFAYATTSETCAHGPVENPSAEGVPGGSSSGSGAAVAAGLVDAALGTDTGGSIRIPASFCGVVGFKPTFRTVPRFGFADLAMSLDHIGPLAPDVETAATVLEAINGPDRRDPSTKGMRTPSPTSGLDTDVDGTTVGLVTEAQESADDDVAAAVRRAADRLEAAGATVESVSLPEFDAQALVNAAVTGTEFTTLVAQAGQDYGVGTGYSEPWREAVAAMDADELGENVRARLVVGRALTELDDGAGYVAAQNVRREFADTVDERLEARDALVLPTTPMTAPDYGDVTDDADLLRTLANTSPFNLTGHPALSVPVTTGRDGNGDPIGCQFVTDWYDEATAVALGRALETDR